MYYCFHDKLRCVESSRTSMRCGALRYLLLLCVVILAHRVDHTRAEQLKLSSGCVKGSGCSQCPADHYTRAPDGSMLCCPGCAAAILYHGSFPSSWCVCYNGTKGENDVESRTIRFPGSSSLESKLPPSRSDTAGFFSLEQTSPARGSLRDALYILNQGEYVETTSPVVSPAVQKALMLMADTLEDLHARVSLLESIVLRTSDLQPSGSIDRVGTVKPSSEGFCASSSFTRIGNGCYHFSVMRDHRAHWKDANDSCAAIGGKLAEPTTRREFIDLAQHLSLSSSTTGFGYWIGGLYPGLSWRWSYIGKEVTLNPSYWTGEDSSGRKVVPGDTTPGRCLTLTYLVKASDYFYAADECGFEKYYICELLERSHRKF
ncbi:uncharacterized protein LOC121869352 isoform X2 [Homarus americanus]|uniref:Putative C-type lectin-like 6 n=1 Tax=Homarus americanus TaxID=6706 RepID=A0A8J5K4J9_HOMAM|nr:uncharacterized protein LOC121869352 isoform X2 [Homarus americanus]KAG7166528.1 putative C-type lectin-like 6 [Homarus americanus]